MGPTNGVGVFMLRCARLSASIGSAFIVGLVLFSSSASASASLSWSRPQPVDPQAAGIALNRVACPTTTQCTAVDGRGQEVTFNPQSPQNPTVVVISSHTLSGLSCPSSTQCTAVDIAGQEVTFNPQTSAGGSPSEVDPSGIPLSLVCPSTSQCTAVDASGQAVTFNPQSPGNPTPGLINPNHILVSLDCPGSSTTWCAAVDSGGGAVTFNPQSLSQQTPVGVDANSPAAVACPATQCAVIDNGGDVATFSAQNGQPPQPQSSAPVDGAGSSAVALNALSCPSDKECVAVDSHGSELVFDPQLPISPGPMKVDGGQVLGGVSCPAATQCTAVDRNGDEVTFNPGSPGNPVPVPIDGHTNLSALACPATTQCTTVDVGGTEATFAPGSSASPNVDGIDTGGGGIFGVACTALDQCTAVDGHGQEVTFNPQSPGSPSPAVIDGGHALNAVVCPTRTICTAVDDIGRAVTFAPQSPGGATASFIDSGHGLQALACPSGQQCTAIDDRGAEVTFNPAAPGHPVVHTIDRVPDTDLACPTVSQCTAVDGSGDEVTFNPLSPSQASALAIDSQNQLSAIACRTPTACVALDEAGRALEGDPRGTQAWNSEAVSTNSLVDVRCPVPTQCVAVDQPGDAFAGASGPLPPVPLAIAGPRIAGRPQAETPLSERHGHWLYGPTSYAYQWERCNRFGARCRVIRGASASSYTPRVADIGHRLRLRETAWNIAGAGRASTSAATALVQPYIGPTTLMLTGVASGRPRLAFTLKTIRGERPLEQVSVTLPGGFRLAGQAGRSGVSVRRGRQSLGFTLLTRGRTFTLRLGKPVSTLSIVAVSPELATTGALRRRAHSRRGRNLKLGFRALLSGGARANETVAVSAR
jgi:hypothetical protein